MTGWLKTFSHAKTRLNCTFEGLKLSTSVFFSHKLMMTTTEHFGANALHVITWNSSDLLCKTGRIYSAHAC